MCLLVRTSLEHFRLDFVLMLDKGLSKHARKLLELVFKGRAVRPCRSGVEQLGWHVVDRLRDLEVKETRSERFILCISERTIVDGVQNSPCLLYTSDAADE